MQCAMQHVRDATQAMIDKADTVVHQAHGREALKRQRGGGPQATRLPPPLAQAQVVPRLNEQAWFSLAQAQVLPQGQEDLTPLALAQALAPEQA